MLSYRPFALEQFPPSRPLDADRPRSSNLEQPLARKDGADLRPLHQQDMSAARVLTRLDVRYMEESCCE